MEKKLSLLFIFSLLLIGTNNYCFGQNVLAQRHINFDEDWKFHFGNAADPLKDFNYSIANIFSKAGGTGNTAIGLTYIDTAWRTLDLPHDWVVELPFVNSSNFDVMA